MKRKIIGLIFFSMLMIGMITLVNAGPSDTAALDRDRDRISDRDRDKVMDCTSDDCGDQLQLRDRYRNRTCLSVEDKKLAMEKIRECDQMYLMKMLQIRDRIRFHNWDECPLA